jgi:epoxide hydrolase-like predicted phosphatase
MKRAVIFDYGGVLVKTVNYTPRHAWDDRLKLPRGSVEQVAHGSPSWRLAQTGQMALVDYWLDVARQLQLTAGDAEQLAKEFYSGDQPDETLLEYLRQLRRRGHIIALLSNASPALRGELAAFGMTELLDMIVPSCEIGVMKPDARAYQVVLERIQRPPDEAIFIDDVAENITGARAVVIHGVLYTAGMDLPAALEPMLNVP